MSDRWWLFVSAAANIALVVALLAYMAWYDPYVL